MRTHLCTLVLLLAIGRPHAAPAVDLRAGYAWDANVNNAHGEDALADGALLTRAGATWTRYGDTGDTCSLGLQAATRTQQRYSGLNQIALGIWASTRHKLGLGAYAPWLWLRWTSSSLHDVDHARASWLHQLEIVVGKRFAPRWNASASYRLDWRRASAQAQVLPSHSGDVFSGRAQTAALHADYAVRERVLVDADGFVRRGDIVSTSDPYRQVFLASKAIAEDDVFADEQYTYRLSAITYGLAGDMRFAVGSESQLVVGMQRQVTHGNGGNDYATTLATVSWLGEF